MIKKILIILSCSISINCLTTYDVKKNKTFLQKPENINIESNKIKYREKATGLEITSILLSGATISLLPAFYSFEEEHEIKIKSNKYKFITESYYLKIKGNKYIWLPLIFFFSDKITGNEVLKIDENKYNQTIHEITNKIKKIEEKKLPILIKTFISGVNSAGGVNISMEIQNISQDTIKYIEFEFELYNAVNDRIKCEVKQNSIALAELTGPINNLQVTTYDWNNLWYNKTANYFKIKKLKIIYFDHEKTLTQEDIEEIQI